MLPIPYDPFGPDALSDLTDRATAGDLLVYGSDLAEALGYAGEPSFEEIIHAALEAAATLHLAVHSHFRAVYRQSGQGTFPDWKLSRIGTYLIVMHADRQRPEVSRAQMYYLRKVV